MPDWCRKLPWWLLTVSQLALLLPAEATAQVSTYAFLRGTVTDGDGLPLPYVNVYIFGTTDGAATSASGHFAFRTRHQGEQQIRAAMIGFEPFEQQVQLSPGDTATVHIVLREALLFLDETIVEADAYTTGDGETATLQSLDVVTTAGAAADIFRAIKTFPGVAMVDEGAGLFVRGGDVSETVILLDQATVSHPYKYESPTGGVFGIIPPFMVRGTVFSSGGFSARYGNALSAILAMDSQDMPLAHQYSLGLGLAAASLGAHIPMLPGRLGVRITGNRSFTETMFRLNGQKDQFLTTPRSYDGNLSVIYRYSSTGRVKLFNFGTNDRLGVTVPEPSFDGTYRGETSSRLHNLQWTEFFGVWFVQTSASFSRYSARQQLGNLDTQPGDDTYKLRTDAEREVGQHLRIGIGAEIERIDSQFRGTVPAREGVLDPAAAKLQLNHTSSATRIGAYGEVEFRPARRVLLLVGARTDYHEQSGHTIVDPRVSARYLVSKASRIRLAWGLYHQFPSSYESRVALPFTTLQPQLARHFIAGWHYEKDQVTLRLEAYDKSYRNLTLSTGESTYLSTGVGEARGLDFFMKFGRYLDTRFNGWIAYSLLDSRRLQARHLRNGFTLEQGPSPYDITHNLTVVGKARLIRFLFGSLTFRHATGRPITPVVDAISAGDGSHYLPVHGPPGSERLPDFRRLDVSANYFVPFGLHNVSVYVSVGNLLNRSNVIDYDYSLDYSSRSERTTQYRRFVYFGAVVNFFL